MGQNLNIAALKKHGSNFKLSNKSETRTILQQSPTFAAWWPAWEGRGEPGHASNRPVHMQMQLNCKLSCTLHQPATCASRSARACAQPAAYTNWTVWVRAHQPIRMVRLWIGHSLGVGDLCYTRYMSLGLHQSYYQGRLTHYYGWSLRSVVQYSQTLDFNTR